MAVVLALVSWWAAVGVMTICDGRGDAVVLVDGVCVAVSVLLLFALTLLALVSWWAAVGVMTMCDGRGDAIVLVDGVCVVVSVLLLFVLWLLADAVMLVQRHQVETRFKVVWMVSQLYPQN
jgi:hypothetical protein